MKTREGKLPYGMTKETAACINCKHFYPHYGAEGNLIYMGHCMYPRKKIRNVDDICGDFSRREPETN